MPTTARGIEYPDSSGSTRLWEHLGTLAQTADAAIDDVAQEVAGGGAFALYTSTSTANISSGVVPILTVPGWSIQASAGGPVFSSMSTASGTVAVAGLHLVVCAVTFTAAASSRRGIVITQNGTERVRQDLTGGPAASTVSVAGLIWAAAGDVIAMGVFQNSGAAVPLGASPGHRYQVLRLPANIIAAMAGVGTPPDDSDSGGDSTSDSGSDTTSDGSSDSSSDTTSDSQSDSTSDSSSDSSSETTS